MKEITVMTSAFGPLPEGYKNASKEQQKKFYKTQMDNVQRELTRTQNNLESIKNLCLRDKSGRKSESSYAGDMRFLQQRVSVLEKRLSNMKKAINKF